MSYVLGVLFVALGIGVSIALHEIGHLVPAKKFGVKVTQYMVGFGPTLWSRHRGETEYGIKAIPLGGYIRMIGMFPPKPGDDPGKLRASTTGRWSQLMDQARQDSLEEVQPGDEDRVFYKLPVRKKVVVMLGGPTMNLLIAVALITGIVTLYGIPTETSRVGVVQQCVQTVSSTAAAQPTTCAATDPVAPANQAGLKPGDRIVRIDGRAVSTFDDVRAAIRTHGGKPLTMVVERGGARRTVTVTPMLTDRPKVDDNGKLVTDALGKVVTERVGFVGMGGSVETVPQPVTAVPALVGSQLSATAGVILKIPQKMAGVAQAAFGSGPRDPNGPMSVVGVGRVAGEVASGEVQGFGGSVGNILIFELGLLASLNMALFVFNLIPLLPLDGGHVAGALWEGLKRAIARVRRRPNPGYVDVAKALPVAYAVSSVLIVMSALLIYADVVNPIKIGG